MKRLYYTLEGKFRELKPVDECPPFTEDTNYPFMDVADSVEEKHITFAMNAEGIYFPVIDSPYFKYPVTTEVPANTQSQAAPLSSSIEIKADIANSLIAAAMNPETAEATRDYLKSLLKEVISEMNINSDDATKK